MVTVPESAREQLAQMIDQAATPPLSNTELDACLQDVPLADEEGKAPVDPAWVPTFDYAEAAAQACELRAAKLATTEQLTSVTSEGTTLQSTPADWQKLADWWRLKSRADAGSTQAAVLGIGHTSVGGPPRSAWAGYEIDWDNLPPAAIPGVIGNWS